MTAFVHEVRALKRAGIHHNVGNDIFRFTVTFRWAGGSASRAVLIKSV